MSERRGAGYVLRPLGFMALSWAVSISLDDRDEYVLVLLWFISLLMGYFYFMVFAGRLALIANRWVVRWLK